MFSITQYCKTLQKVLKTSSINVIICCYCDDHIIKCGTVSFKTNPDYYLHFKCDTIMVQ